MLSIVDRWLTLYQGQKRSHLFDIEEMQHELFGTRYRLSCKMTKFEMSRLSDKEAFLMSIGKWIALERFHSKRKEEEIYVGNIEGQSCALCQKYPNSCIDCPVAEKIGQSSCFNTPYYDYSSEPTHAHAVAELKFLVNTYTQGV